MLYSFEFALSSMTAYYLPIYFQSIQGVSATESSVRFIALVCPQIVGLVIVGAFVSAWGYYVPYIIAGVIITSVGAGLLTTLGVATSTVNWAAYMAINGLGIGMAQQLLYTALQAVLGPLDVATGNVLSASHRPEYLPQRACCFYSQIHDCGVPQVVIAVGATGLAKLAQSPELLLALRKAYAQAIRQALIVGLAGACGGFPFAWAMQWLNIKKVAAERQQKEAEAEAEVETADSEKGV